MAREKLMSRREETGGQGWRRSETEVMELCWRRRQALVEGDTVQAGLVWETVMVRGRDRSRGEYVGNEGRRRWWRYW